MICYIDKVRHGDGQPTFVASVDLGPGIRPGRVERMSRYGAVQWLKEQGCKSWIVRIDPPLEITWEFGDWDGDPPPE